MCNNPSSPTRICTTSPTLVLLCIQAAGAQADAFTARSSLPSAPVKSEGAEHME